MMTRFSHNVMRLPMQLDSLRSRHGLAPFPPWVVLIGQGACGTLVLESLGEPRSDVPIFSATGYTWSLEQAEGSPPVVTMGGRLMDVRYGVLFVMKVVSDRQQPDWWRQAWR